MFTSFPMMDSSSFQFTRFLSSKDLYRSCSSSFNWNDFILGKKIRRDLVLISQPKTVLASSNQPSAINFACCRILERFTCSIFVSGWMRQQSRISGMTFLILWNRDLEYKNTVIKSSM